MHYQQIVAMVFAITINGLAGIMPTQAGEEEAGRDHIFGDGIDVDVVYKAGVMSTVSGGLKRGTAVLGNLDVQVMVDAEKRLGWRGGSIFLYGLSNLGGKPNAQYADTAQGIDNIEVGTRTAKLYEAWVQQVLLDDKLSLLAGLYDLNSEFYVTDTAGLFLHPSAGIGPDLSQTGKNGPSIFSTTSVALRAKVQPTPDFYIQGAVLDGVPGDPKNHRGTHIQFNKGDGALVIAEAGYLRGDHGQVFLSDKNKDDKATEPFGKYAIGTWYYTAKFDDLIDKDGLGDPIRRNNNRGVYFLAEQSLYHEAIDSSQGLAAFLRYGVANADINRFQKYMGVGAVYTGLIPGRDSDQLGFSVSNARNGAKYRQSQLDEGTPAQSSETSLELSYRAQLTPWLAVQPDIQYIIHPGTNPKRNNATVIGVRFESTLSK